MSNRAAIVGVGHTAFRPLTPEASYRELAYEAAVKAYHDAGVDARRDIGAFVTVGEDFIEGIAITDCYMPDQLGGAMRPVHTITGGGLQALATGVMLVRTGAFEVVAVAGHSKLSNVLTPNQLVALALDPVLNRPLRANPYFVAGLEMARYLFETGNTREQCARVVADNHLHALLNPSAAYGAAITADDVLAADDVASPLGKLDIAGPADGAVVVVLASAEAARSLRVDPVWILGVGWCSDSPSLETRDWSGAAYTRKAAEMAYRMAGIRSPSDEVDLAEVDDTFSYKQLQHLEALRLCRVGEAGVLFAEGAFEPGGLLPVNLSGGSLGVGNLGDVAGLMRVAEAVAQLREEAGQRQVPEVTTALVHEWRGIPTTTGAVAILGREEPRGMP